MPHRLILKVSKVQFPPPKRLGTVVKNILGGHHAPLHVKYVKEGLPKNDVIDIVVSKKPDTVHTSTLKKVAVHSKTNKPIDPEILAKKNQTKEKHLNKCVNIYNMNMDMYSCIFVQ